LWETARGRRLGELIVSLAQLTVERWLSDEPEALVAAHLDRRRHSACTTAR
jgi:hypothetical protein